MRGFWHGVSLALYADTRVADILAVTPFLGLRHVRESGSVATMTSEQIIAAWGGVQQVSTMTGASRNAVHNWKRDGIPSKFWHLFTRSHDGRQAVSVEVLQASRPSRSASRNTPA